VATSARPASPARPGGPPLSPVRTAAALLLLSAAALAGDAKVKEGAWNKRDVPKGWVTCETEHYQVQSQIGEELAQKLGAHLEAMLTLYAEFIPTRRKMETSFVLKVFQDKKGFCDYAGLKPDTGVVAYYRQDTRELVGYDCGFIFGKRTIPAALQLKPSTGDGLTDQDRVRITELLEATTDAYFFDLVRVLSHEGWHQYFHFYTVSWVPMPSWLDEGLGDYFFMVHREEKPDGQVEYRLGDMNSHRLRSIRRGLEDGKAVTFEKLMDFVQADYYSNPGVFYAQGWSMVQFLMQSPDPARRELIPRLIKDFKDSKNFVKSTDKIFKKQDLAALDQEWIGWLLTLPLSDPLLTLAREFGDRLKPEGLQGEQRLIDVYKWYLEHPDFPGGSTITAPAAQGG